jgi:hypothetical protein
MKVREVTKLFMGLVAISFLNVACQGNMSTDSMLKAGGASTEAASSPEELNSKVDMAAVEKTVADSKVAMNEAQSILAQFSNKDGSIKLWDLMFSSTSSTDVESQSIFIIYEKLSEVLNKVLDKVSEVKGKFGEARALLAAEAAKLDPNRPDHQLILQQINQMMAQIDLAESQFSAQLNMLAGQLDLVNNGIDVLTGSASALFPGAGIIVGILTNQVKMAITEFQTKLRLL